MEYPGASLLNLYGRSDTQRIFLPYICESLLSGTAYEYGTGRVLPASTSTIDESIPQLTLPFFPLDSWVNKERSSSSPSSSSPLQCSSPSGDCYSSAMVKNPSCPLRRNDPPPKFQYQPAVISFWHTTPPKILPPSRRIYGVVERSVSGCGVRESSLLVGYRDFVSELDRRPPTLLITKFPPYSSLPLLILRLLLTSLQSRVSL